MQSSEEEFTLQIGMSVFSDHGVICFQARQGALLTYHQRDNNLNFVSQPLCFLGEIRGRIGSPTRVASHLHLTLGSESHRAHRYPLSLSF